jgi:thiol-disulfide isomerase/thioredoxin
MFCHAFVPVSPVEPLMSRSPLSLVFAALLYGAIGLTANTVTAAELSPADRAILKDMRSGDMAKLVIHKAPRDRIDEPFLDFDGNSLTLADYSGKVVLLNIWATWCPPCRAEMPSLDRLAGELQGPDFALVALSIDRADVSRVVQFYQEIQIQNLDIRTDRKSNFARKAGVLGLPMTLILDRQGREIARMLGDAAWDTPEARALLDRFIEMTRPTHG